MKTEEIEERLREILRDRAERISEVSPRGAASEDPDLVRLADRPVTARRNLAAAAAIVVLAGAVGVGLWGSRGQQQPRVEELAQQPEDRPAEDSRWRAWPLNDDEPLSTDSHRAQLASPETTARAYLTEVVGLASDWPIGPVSIEGDRAVASYVLQDVAGEIRMARDAESLWYVTSATTDLTRPGAPVSTAEGLDLSFAAGPRTYEGGSPIRVTVLATGGGRLLEVPGRVSGPPKGDEGGSAPVWSLQWPEPEMAAAVRADVLDDHDGDSSTPDVTIGHWSAAVAPPLFGMPAGSDPLRSEPFFAAAGGPDDVALAYLRDRFPDYPNPGISAAEGRRRGRAFYVRWDSSDSSGTLASGVIALRESSSRYGVVAATTDGIDLSGLHVSNGRVQGRITAQNQNSLFADVLQPDETPAAGSPNPNGQPGAEYRFGTAAGPGEGSLYIDVPVEPGSAVVRVNLVGGTILSVTEVRLAVPPARP